MGIRLTEYDEGVHHPGDQINWNESRYIDFWDPQRRTGGWFRIGARPNARYAEMSACLFLPDGRVAFAFEPCRDRDQRIERRWSDLGDRRAVAHHTGPFRRADVAVRPIRGC